MIAAEIQSFPTTAANTTTAANGTGRPPTPGGFYFGEFTPDFLLKVNDWMFLEAEIAVNADGSVSVGSFAQADFFVNDWLTIDGLPSTQAAIARNKIPALNP